MNKVIAAIVGAATIAGAIYWFYPTIAAVAMTDDELNACAVQVALGSPVNGKYWTYEGRVDALLVDTPGGDLLGEARSDAKHYSLKTISQVWVDEGAKLCLKMKMAGETIKTPDLKVRDGYHIYRWNGSAQLVKNGDADPVFKCIDGYHPNGTGCVR
jgi:hypothetical protein